MPDARNIREQVEARVAELEAILAPLRAEHEQLKDVAAAFGDTGGRAAPTLGTAPSRPRSRGAAAGAGAGGGGSRGEQAMKLVDEAHLVRDMLHEVERADYPDGAVREVQGARQRGDYVDVRPGVLVNAQVPLGPVVGRAGTRYLR